MDVALSILAGLGLRLFLVLSTNSSPSNKLTTAVLGLWEGVILHQLSGRSTNANLDHVLAYGLRVAVDLLVSKNLQRMVMVLLWSALGTVASEAVVPHADLRAAVKKERERQRERRHKHSRSIPQTVPILSTPYPPRIRAYRPPNHDSTEPSGNPALPTDPPLLSSTPIFPTDRPPTPPSFFLQENTISSPSPKPVLLQVHPAGDPSPHDALPVRPRSGLATTLDRSSDSGSPLPVPNHLPTPPDSAVPSDGLVDPGNETRHETHIPRFEHQLYTIPELSSPEDNDTPTKAEDQASNDAFALRSRNAGAQHGTYPSEFETTDMPLPVPNSEIRHLPHNTVIEWLTSQPTSLDPGIIFRKPFAAAPSDNANPLPVLLRPQEALWDISTPTKPTQLVLEETRNVEEKLDENHQAGNQSEIDELLTPGAREKLDLETDNENDSDPLRTPKQLQQNDGEGQLSPLSLNVRSALGQSSGSEPPFATFDPEIQLAPEVAEDDLPIPGSLSQNPLLHPPLPSSGSFLPPIVPPPESPPPPSPSTIHSDPSDISILSTSIPNKQYRRGEELRQQARQEETVRSQLEDQRRRAEQEGRVLDALSLKVKIRELDAEAYKLHEKAARRFFSARNTLTKVNEIDVHGLRPREAFERVERAIVKASEERRSVVRVIVGKGLHSVDQRPTLKPAVQREVQRWNLQCDVDARNAGVLIITLPGPRI